MFENLFYTFIKFIYAPLIFKDMLWILLPLLFSIWLIELYFKRYPREGLGHHRSLENTIFLIFVFFDLIRYLLVNQNVNSAKVFVILVFLIFSVFVSFYDFFHKLPLKSLFKISSKTTIAFFTYIVIILIYSDMLDIISLLHIVNILISVTGLFLIIVFIKKLFVYLEPRSYDDMEHFLANIEKDIKKTSEKLKKEELKEEKIKTNKLKKIKNK